MIMIIPRSYATMHSMHLAIQPCMIGHVHLLGSLYGTLNSIGYTHCIFEPGTWFLEIAFVREVSMCVCVCVCVCPPPSPCKTSGMI